MIELTSLSGKLIHLNCDQIRFIESSPDTIIHFMDGKTLVVKNTQEEVVRKVLQFRQLIARGDLSWT